MNRRIGLLSVVFLAASSLLFSQQIDRIRLHQLDSSEFPVIRLSFSLEDSAGEYQPMPWPEDFEVSENGTAEQVWGFEEEHAPASLVLILDSSGSMEGSMQAVLSAASSLIGMLDGEDEAEIIDFDSEVKILHDFTGDREALRGALDSVNVGGSTALYDSIVKGLQDVEERKGLKALVLLTDGRDENAQGQRQSTTNLDGLTKLIEKAQVPIYLIGLGAGVDKEVLETIARHSHGKVYYAAESGAVQKIYEEILAYLHSLHRIFYISRDGGHDASKRTVLVKLKDSNAQVRAEYTAPDDPFWSYCFKPYEDGGYKAMGLAISAEGSVIIEPQCRGLLSKEGIRTSVDWRWADSYKGTLSSAYYLARGGWGWHGSLFTCDGGILEEVEDLGIISAAPAPVHSDWEWSYVGISRNGRYVLAVSRDSEQFDFTFLLLDREEPRVLWEHEIYEGEFDEPGEIEISNDGTCFICQDMNLFVVDRSGNVKFKKLWQETGKRYVSLAVAGDGSRFIAFLEEGDASLDKLVEVYDAQGNVVWALEAEPGEFSYTVDVSENGKYFGVCDSRGVRIFARDGGLLYKDFRGDTRRYYGTGLAIANDGSFAYGLANRIHYHKLK